MGKRPIITKDFRAAAHAGHGEGEYDLVCCGVSALAINAVNSVETFTEDACEIEAAEDGGYLNVRFSRTGVLEDGSFDGQSCPGYSEYPGGIWRRIYYP